ncbi:MAG TPA: RNA polymerase sigma factor [Thermoanaerobaculia bacterium]
MMTIPSDEILAAASAKGDGEAFDRLASRYGNELDGYFRRRLPDDGRVEELRQETLLALLSLLPSYRERGRFRSLIYSIAYRKLVSSRRAERPSSALSKDLPAPGVNPEVIDVRRALGRLPEPLREALFLTALEGLSAEEAGEVLGCSADAVRARTCRARTMLARSLDTRRTP